MKKDFILKIRKLTAGKNFSTFQSIFKGSWIEISDFRKYVPWDPLRYINRKLSAKHHELYTQLFQVERDVLCDVFLDINYNRRWKKDNNYTQEIIWFLREFIWYAHKNSISIRFFYPELSKVSRFQIIKKKAELKHVSFWKRYTQAISILDHFQDIVKNTNKKYQSLLPDFLDYARKNSKKRAIIVFSDFLDISDEDTKVLSFLDSIHGLNLFKLPVDDLRWQNYNKFFSKEQSYTSNITDELD